MVIAAGTTAAQAQQARDTRKDAEEFRRRREEQEKRAAREQLRLVTDEIHAQQINDSRAAAQEIQSNARAARQAVAQATVTAGEIGAFGQSFVGLIDEFERQQTEFEATVEQNLTARNLYAKLQLESAELNTESRLFNAQTMSIPKPNYLGFALQGLGTGLQLGGQVDRIRESGSRPLNVGGQR